MITTSQDRLFSDRLADLFARKRSGLTPRAGIVAVAANGGSRADYQKVPYTHHVYTPFQHFPRLPDRRYGEIISGVPMTLGKLAVNAIRATASAARFEIAVMFKRRTLFILGAGSSAEVGLPLGKELASAIGKKMDIRFEHGFNPIGDGDLGLFSQVTGSRRHESTAYQIAAWRIRDGIAFAQSIDDFLDQHRTN